jgi:replicative DNA helicase
MAGKKKEKKITEIFTPGKVFVITGPNESGKTRFAMGLVADCAIKDKQGALYMPLDKDTIRCASRMAEVHSGVPLYAEGKTKITSAQWRKLMDAVNDLADAPVYLSDMQPGALTPLLREIRKFAAKKVKLVVVDNAGLLRGKRAGGSNSTLCGRFKKLAQDIKAAVVLVAPIYKREIDGEADSVLELEAPWLKKRKAK